jgi:ribonuclease VapC
MRSEPGSDKIAAISHRSTISSVNLTESIHKVVQKGSARRIVEQLFRELRLNVVEWSEDLSYSSAEFAMFGRSHGLSLGDRACLTLARNLHATAVTSDRAWRQVPGLGVALQIFR